MAGHRPELDQVLGKSLYTVEVAWHGDQACGVTCSGFESSQNLIVMRAMPAGDVLAHVQAAGCMIPGLD